MIWVRGCSAVSIGRRELGTGDRSLALCGQTGWSSAVTIRRLDAYAKSRLCGTLWTRHAPEESSDKRQWSQLNYWRRVTRTEQAVQFSTDQHSPRYSQLLKYWSGYFYCRMKINSRSTESVYWISGKVWKHAARDKCKLCLLCTDGCKVAT
jgi:ferredoxin